MFKSEYLCNTQQKVSEELNSPCRCCSANNDQMTSLKDNETCSRKIHAESKTIIHSDYNHTACDSKVFSLSKTDETVNKTGIQLNLIKL